MIGSAVWEMNGLGFWCFGFVGTGFGQAVVLEVWDLGIWFRNESGMRVLGDEGLLHPETSPSSLLQPSSSSLIAATSPPVCSSSPRAHDDFSSRTRFNLVSPSPSPSAVAFSPADRMQTDHLLLRVLDSGFTEEGDAEELAEVEAKLNADFKPITAATKTVSKADDDLKKQRRPFLTQFFSPIFLKAFSITFFGEWGDKSQVVSRGQALCTTAAVLGGKSLASQISEKMVALSGGILFLVFGVQSFLAAVGES